MHDLYWLPQTIPKLEAPQKWSFTSLNVFHSCPRRWQLSNAKFGHLGGKAFPTNPNPAQVTGNVVHYLLEHFEGFLYEKHQSLNVSDTSNLQEALLGFEARTRARTLLKEKVRPKIEKNPRCNASQLLSKVSLDDCVQGFKKILGYRYPDGLKNYKSIARKTDNRTKRKKRRTGGEIEIEVDDPPLIGRVDAMVGNNIFEYKTGSYSEDHIRQIEFYALLYWYKFNSCPENVEIHYASGHPPIAIDNINAEKIRELDGQLRSTLKGVQKTIQSSKFKACPSEENCRYCSVRPLCDEYWSSGETLPLRFEGFLKSVAESEAIIGRAYLDVEISDFPTQWVCGEPLVGKVELGNKRSTELRFGRSHCPDAGPHQPTKARILGAVVRTQGKDFTISSAANTEIFWAM